VVNTTVTGRPVEQAKCIVLDYEVIQPSFL